MTRDDLFGWHRFLKPLASDLCLGIQFHIYLSYLGTCSAKCLQCAFNQEKALEGASSVIVQSSQRFVSVYNV